LIEKKRKKFVTRKKLIHRMVPKKNKVYNMEGFNSDDEF
jgi:hypothetical protein